MDLTGPHTLRILPYASHTVHCLCAGLCIPYVFSMRSRGRVSARRLSLAGAQLSYNSPPASHCTCTDRATRVQVATAADSGILILLDMHRLVGEIWPDPRGLWYSVSCASHCPNMRSPSAHSLPTHREHFLHTASPTGTRLSYPRTRCTLRGAWSLSASAVSGTSLVPTF